MSVSSSTTAGPGLCSLGVEPGTDRASGSASSNGLLWNQDTGPAGFAACGLDGQLRNAPQARDFVADTLSGWALDSLVTDAALVVSELVTNAVQHAVDPAAPGIGDYPVWLGIFLHPGDLVCAVTDPSSIPPRPHEAAEDALVGRGLALISALSDTWSWELTPPRGKTVWAALPLPPHGPDTA
ncbi:ATP-binding protein [Streptomyces sp. NPDC051018]|uniref:ATP-binding protein n=1 Tax=Streptomyces sp. NPDC051018 TaxID=3365639 RepID=UPI0037B84CF0